MPRVFCALDLRPAAASLLLLAVGSSALAKKVICIDVQPGAQSRFLNNHEGYERALGLGQNDVIHFDGDLAACLGMVANGDELVIIAHGAPGSFDWGNQT